MVGLEIRLRRENRRHTVVNRDRSIRSDKAMLEQLFARRFAVAPDHRSGLKTAQLSSRYQFERCRDEPPTARRNRSFVHCARLRARLKCNSKRVEVMAGDDHSALRDVVRKVGIAMIGDVEYVEVATQPPQKARIIQEPIQQTVQVEFRWAAAIVLLAVTRESPPEKWADQRWSNVSSLFCA
jgi:hypothetical protein